MQTPPRWFRQSEFGPQTRLQPACGLLGFVRAYKACGAKEKRFVTGYSFRIFNLCSLRFATLDRVRFQDCRMEEADLYEAALNYVRIRGL
jgi:hypothetical protein